MKTKLLTLVFFFNIIVYGQNIKILSVSPAQDIIGASTNCSISVLIDKRIDSLQFVDEKLFKINGTNSGLINGTVEIDTFTNSFVFMPSVSFFAGEIINICFGPVVTVDGDTLKSFNWQFSVEITNPTTAKFDSLKRFDLPSTGYPATSALTIAMDYNKDGFIDLLSGTLGYVFFNNGFGEFEQYENIPQLFGLRHILDLNNDKNNDLIVYNENNGDVNIFLGNNDSGYIFSEKLYPFNIWGGIIIACGDITGDGCADLISKENYTTTDYCWRKFINDGNGKFIRDTSCINLHNRISEGKLIDMNKDGNLDLVLLNTDSQSTTEFEGFYIFFNDGKGNFNNYLRQEFLMGTFPDRIEDLRQLKVMDYDNNGMNDIAAFGSMNGGLLMLQQSFNNFYGYTTTNFSGAENFAYFTSGDINGDNRIDIVVSNYQVCQECDDTGDVAFEATINSQENYFWGHSTSGGFFQLGKRNIVGYGVTPVLADVDNDGDLDIIHCAYPTTITYNHTNIVGVEDNIVEPSGFILSQNYPNPFNGATNISYYLPKANNVKISVYNMLGELIEILVNDYCLAGTHDITFDPKELCSGLYLYKIEYEAQTKIKKMIYLK
ncbi:MAG: T9SS type A sorting domain-containing protein [bacterium]